MEGGRLDGFGGFMFDLMTERLETVIARAHGEALQRGDQELGPGHLLVALLVVRLGNAYRALKNEGLTVAMARKALLQVRGPGPGKSGSKRTAFSPVALDVLNRAESLAADLDTDEFDTPHLLIALLDLDTPHSPGALLDGESGEATRMLDAMGVSPARVRSETFRILQHQGPLSGTSLDYDLRKLLEGPEGKGIRPLLDRARAAHRAAFKAREWERSARIAGAVSEIAFTAFSGFEKNWVPLARERLEEVLGESGDTRREEQGMGWEEEVADEAGRAEGAPPQAAAGDTAGDPQ